MKLKQPQHIVRVSKPCQEDWEQMAPAAKERHCAACQKHIVDFTLMSDAEIIEAFKKADGGAMCGRFLTTQVGREMVDNSRKIRFVGVVAKRAAALALIVQSVVADAQVAQIDTAHVQHVDSARQDTAGRLPTKDSLHLDVEAFLMRDKTPTIPASFTMLLGYTTMEPYKPAQPLKLSQVLRSNPATPNTILKRLVDYWEGKK